MKSLVISIFVVSFVSMAANAATVLRCTGKRVMNDGARINLIQSSNGKMRANLIFGTTVSGTMYNVTEVSPGIYEGHINGRGENFWIKLTVSDVSAENKYIRGFESKLEAVYPTLQNESGQDQVTTTIADEFTCGVQIRGYSQR